MRAVIVMLWITLVSSAAVWGAPVKNLPPVIGQAPATSRTMDSLYKKQGSWEDTLRLAREALMQDEARRKAVISEGDKKCEDWMTEQWKEVQDETSKAKRDQSALARESQYKAEKDRVVREKKRRNQAMAQQAAENRGWIYEKVAADFSEAKADLDAELADSIWQEDWKPGDFKELGARYAKACAGKFKARAEELAKAARTAEGLASVRSCYRKSRAFTSMIGRINELNGEALRLAVEDMASAFPGKYDGKAHRRAVENFEKSRGEWLKGLEAGDAAALDQAGKSLAAVRGALLANPLLNDAKVLLLKRGFPVASNARAAMGHAAGLGALNAHNSDTIPRKGLWNDELAVLGDLRGAPALKTLYRAPGKETLIDPDLHFNADRVLFAKEGQGGNWRLFELGVGADGKAAGAPREISPNDGSDVGHFDPCYLPDGRIVFASTAVYHGLPCTFGAVMCSLYQLNPKDGSIRQLTFEQDSDWCPAMLPSGRVLYQRWEYSDLSHSNSRRLFHMNPDGTDQREFYGSGSDFPGSIFYATSMPGHPRKIIGVAGGHHGTPRSGRLMIFDPAQGRRNADGIVQEIPGRGKKVEVIVRDRLVDGVWPQFLMPCPLNEKYVLVTCKPRPNALWGLYLVDVFDNMTLLYEEEGAALFKPKVLAKRPVPPLVPDRVELARKDATVHIADIYAGGGLAGVKRGTVKSIRIIDYYFAYRGMGGLLGSIGMDGPWDMKRIAGTVPVEEDGSVFFKVPANIPFAMQPLDEQGRALQLMRSWTVGMPGEHISCVGCHELQNETLAVGRSKALTRQPSEIREWHGPDRGFMFAREVQPVLDRYCVSCHGSADLAEAYAKARPGEDRKPYLKGDRMINDWRSGMGGSAGVHGGKFSMAYAELHRFVRRPGIESDNQMLSPMDYHFSSTELCQLLRKGHHGVKLDAEAWERLAAWADLNAPFHGRWGDIVKPEVAAKTAARARELAQKYAPGGPIIDYEAVPEIPRYDSAPAVPEKVLPPPAAPKLAGWPLEAKQGKALRNGVGKILDVDGVRYELARIPGGEFVMGAVSGYPDESPCAAVKVNPFLMGATEVTNELFLKFTAQHESRDEARHGYSFGQRGYPQDDPKQPAVRVSWEEAVAFCEWLSRVTRMKVSLPTEAQWEWACRAGADTPFWFGGLDADYSKFANLGDQTLRDFAQDTASKSYTTATLLRNPGRYDDWIPRDDRYKDGGLVTVAVGSYKPNPWGLYDMHGNAWEWTRSAYRPYPYREDDGRNAMTPGEEKVARGGSWYDRPKRCTASVRLPYQSFQRVFNVGFRVIVEE